MRGIFGRGVGGRRLPAAFRGVLPYQKALDRAAEGNPLAAGVGPEAGTPEEGSVVPLDFGPPVFRTGEHPVRGVPYQAVRPDGDAFLLGAEAYGAGKLGILRVRPEDGPVRGAVGQDPAVPKFREGYAREPYQVFAVEDLRPFGLDPQDGFIVLDHGMGEAREDRVGCTVRQVLRQGLAVVETAGRYEEGRGQGGGQSGRGRSRRGSGAAVPAIPHTPGTP